MSTPVKYPLLHDKDWLHQKYVTEKLSSVAIGKIVGCGAGCVITALYRRGIKTRSVKETVHRGHKGFECPFLNDPIWLKQKYKKEKLNSYEIAALANTNQHSVMCALQYHKIKTRSFSEAAKNRKSFWRKYEELNDKVWLYQRYVEEQKSSIAIANLIGTTATSVIKALKKFEIEVRSSSEASNLITKESKYSVLNDPDLLNKMYTEDKLSTIAISEILGVKSCNSVRQSLIKHQIEVRNYREAQIHSREDDGFIYVKPVIDGGMIGDAFFGIYDIESEISMPYYTRRNKHYDHVLWVAKQLIKFNPTNYVHEEDHKLNDKIFKYSVLRTLTHDCLKTDLRRWYPKYNDYDPDRNYMKIIPEDVDISPLSLLHAFLDDGSTYRRKREKEKSFKKQVYVTLSLQGFPRDNLEMFCEKFKKEYGYDTNIKTRPCTDGYGYLIEVSQGSYQKFMDIIGPCPEPLKEVFGYKWK